MLKKDTSIVVSIGDDGAIVSSFKNNKLLKRIFVTSPMSADFLELTKNNPTAPIYLLLDTIDQNYIFTNIPNVGKSNVSKIVKRKIQNEYDPNDINSYLFLGKDVSNARNDLRYLFVSIRNSSPLTDWVEAINELPNRFVGMYLVPVEAEDFIAKIRTAVHGEKKFEGEHWEVFISHNRVGGFRQIVLKGGKLIFTRISQAVSLQTPDAIGTNISQEAANTIEYIRRIGFNETNISMYIICSKEAGAFIDIPGIQPKDIYVHNPFELAQKIGLPEAAQENDKFGDVIFSANFIAAKKKLMKLTTPQILAVEKLVMLSTVSTFASFAIIAALPLASLYMLYTGYTASSEAEEVEQRMQAAQGEITNIKDFEKEYGIKPELLVDLVKSKRDFSTKDKSFYDILKKYKEADTFSQSLEEIIYTSGERGVAVAVKAKFDFTGAQNYSDKLFTLEKFKNTIITAFPDSKVELTGMPSETDIKVDLENKEKKEDNVVITVTITPGGNENAVPQ